MDPFVSLHLGGLDKNAAAAAAADDDDNEKKKSKTSTQKSILVGVRDQLRLGSDVSCPNIFFQRARPEKLAELGGGGGTRARNKSSSMSTYQPQRTILV